MKRALTLVVVLAACSRSPAMLEPERVVAGGDVAQFGSGPVAVSADARHVVMELREGANVWFFNVHPDGWADLLYSRPLPRGRTEVTLPRAAINQTGAPNQPLAGSRARRATEASRRSSMSRTRLLRREALLIVVWPRGVDPAPTFVTSHLLVDELQPHWEVPEMMFEGRQTTWASYLLEK